MATVAVGKALGCACLRTPGEPHATIPRRRRRVEKRPRRRVEKLSRRRVEQRWAGGGVGSHLRAEATREEHPGTGALRIWGGAPRAALAIIHCCPRRRVVSLGHDGAVGGTLRLKLAFERRGLQLQQPARASHSTPTHPRPPVRQLHILILQLRLPPTWDLSKLVGLASPLASPLTLEVTPQLTPPLTPPRHLSPLHALLELLAVLRAFLVVLGLEDFHAPYLMLGCDACELRERLLALRKRLLALRKRPVALRKRLPLLGRERCLRRALGAQLLREGFLLPLERRDLRPERGERFRTCFGRRLGLGGARQLRLEARLGIACRVEFSTERLLSALPPLHLRRVRTLQRADGLVEAVAQPQVLRLLVKLGDGMAVGNGEENGV